MRRLLVIFAVIAVSACSSSVGTTVATTGGGGTISIAGGTEAQQRATVRGPLRRAGVSEACIESLSGSDLNQVRAFVSGKRPRNSMDAIRYNQQVRTFVGRYCDPV